MVPGLNNAAKLHLMFGRWAAKELVKESWDVVHLCGGIAQWFLERIRRSGRCAQLVRHNDTIESRIQQLPPSGLEANNLHVLFLGV
jgi:hypothetical protein